ncbi:MAG: hypothetical protein A2511_05770 [Deltaproteobacteria bacterium RIFOXYD12_FULL_50_9]|nr:MAG: hypothetical protein A2511_05770 [Deltaproteobacteria bacterium RIFOXYD12_FULL_50_9]
MTTYHYVVPEILNPTHPVTVHLVGVGGTGSMILSELGRIDKGLRALGHPGLFVVAFDPDTVSEANVGRQLFATQDIGCNKARLLVERVNRFYGLAWESIPYEYSVAQLSTLPQILITAVDTGKARQKIGAALKTRFPQRTTKSPLYWLDAGNRAADGQVVLGCMGKIKQPSKGAVARLETIVDLFNLESLDAEQDQGPSCSLAEALDRQDLFINRAMATFAGDLLWKMFREGRLAIHGCFINLAAFRVNPLPVKRVVIQKQKKAA